MNPFVITGADPPYLRDRIAERKVAEFRYWATGVVREKAETMGASVRHHPSRPMPARTLAQKARLSNDVMS
jgi:hypothetical protein